MSLDLFRSSAMTKPRSFVDSANGTFLVSWMLAIRSRSVSIGSTRRAFVRSLTGPSSGVGALIVTPELTMAGKASSPFGRSR